MKKVLFLCSGNSCRSIMAEAILNHHGTGRFEAFSAGSHPTGYIHPKTIKTIAEQGMVAENYRSKSWDEFTEADIDIVITVCDNADNEICPIFSGSVIKTHWSVPDPTNSNGSDEKVEAEFLRVFKLLEKHIKALL